MINLLGYLVFVLTILAVFKVGAIYTIIEQALLLAPELTYVMISLFLYPLLLSLALQITGKNKPEHHALLKGQSGMAGTIAVSLGLIGTFQGLTSMITAIAQSMGGEGDITEKMGTMIASISVALSAMSYAFITSILGVAVSVLLMLSMNFWSFRFKEVKQKGVNQTEVLAELGKSLNALMLQNKEMLETVQTVVSGDARVEELTHALNSLIESNKCFHTFQVEAMESIKVGSTSITDTLNAMKEDQAKIASEFNTNLDATAKYIQLGSISITDALKNIHIEQTNLASDLNANILNELAKIESRCAQSVDGLIENKFIMSEIKCDIENERRKVRNALKAIAE
ncbi:hypothetical protein DDN69_17385 [Vibrio cholerae]|nr:hypothetical protein [Vibrio cholerae]